MAGIRGYTASANGILHEIGDKEKIQKSLGVMAFVESTFQLQQLQIVIGEDHDGFQTIDRRNHCNDVSHFYTDGECFSGNRYPPGNINNSI